MKPLNILNLKSKPRIPLNNLSNVLSQEQLLDLQDNFINCGLHYIKINNYSMYGIILNDFFKSIKCYDRIACLSTRTLNLTFSYENLYQELLSAGLTNKVDNGEIEDFLLTNFYYDFLAIDASYELIQSSWYCNFEKLLLDYKLIDTLPVVMFIY